MRQRRQGERSRLYQSAKQIRRRSFIKSACSRGGVARMRFMQFGSAVSRNAPAERGRAEREPRHAAIQSKTVSESD